MPFLDNEFLRSLKEIFNGLKFNDKEELYNKIVNAPFEYRIETAHLFLGIIVLLIEDKNEKVINRVALSDTELARYTTTVSKIPFNDIKVPLDDKSNIIAKVVRTGKPDKTTDWKYLFTPALTAEQARINQAGGGIAYSFVYPLSSKDPRGALIFSYYQYPENISNEHNEFMGSYSEIVSSVLRNNA